MLTIKEPTSSTKSTDIEDTSDRSDATSENEADDWVKKHILAHNMLSKAKLLTSMKKDTDFLKSITKENLNRMSTYHAEERAREHEEDLLEELEEKQADIDNNLRVDRIYTNAQGDFLMSFFKKSADEVRAAYINKLVSMKIMKLEPAKKHQTMLIYDWDDTLLCTYYLAGMGLASLPPEILNSLSPLDESASKLLLRSIELGDTFIITNSSEGWVQQSGKLFLPKTYQVIHDKNIKVISARTDYEDRFPGDALRWKVEAFLDMEKHFNKDIVTNLICLGDSQIEIQAAHILAQKFRQAIIKTIKFKEHPKPDEMIKQHDLVFQKLEQIYISPRNLTIRMEKKAKGNHHISHNEDDLE